MAPGAASGVSAGAGWLLGKHQPHALKEEEGGSQGGGEQGTPIPPARSTAGQARSCRAQGWGWCLFQLQTHRPLQCPPHASPQGAIQTPAKPAERGGRIAGSSTAGSSPAGSLARHRASLGSRGVGREAVAGPRGDAPPEEILLLIFHRNPSCSSEKRHPRSITWPRCMA